MRKSSFVPRVAVFMVLLISLLPASGLAMDMGLVNMLVDKLGVTEKQAEGGAGAIFKTAESRMPESDYKQLSDSVPEADALQSAAPVTDTNKGLIGGAASMLGGTSDSSLGDTASSLGDTADLLSSFKELGMDQEMIGKFTPVIYDYVKEKGGAIVMEMLQKALTF